MNGSPWSAEEDEILRRTYKLPRVTGSQIARDLGRSTNSVRNRAAKLRLVAATDADFGAAEMATEEWRSVDGFALYFISSLGRLKGRWGNLAHLYPTPKGYLAFNLHKGGERHSRSIHVLVAEAFIGPRPDGCEVSHLDGSKPNNRATNLAYKTPAENATDKISHGTHLSGERVPTAKLTDAEAREIRGAYRRYSKEFGGPALAKIYGVNKETIRRVALGTEHWRHL